MKFLPEIQEPEERRLRFRYWNWHGDDHQYVITPESMQLGSYDIGGTHEGKPLNFVMHGTVETRDMRPHPGRRTFIVAKMREIEILP